MTAYEWPGFLLIFFVTLVLTFGPLSSKFPRNLQKLILGAFFVRVFGSLLRHWTLQHIYHWVGDAVGYFSAGLRNSKLIWNFDFSFLTPEYGDKRLWGTPMMKDISGFFISVIGPTMRGEFLIFSFLSFVGLLLICRSFQKNYPHQDVKRYAFWILMWPCLWYWPSSVGKDAWILMATGIVVYGYARQPNRMSWTPMIIGLVMISIIRPHIAGVLVVSIAAAHWLSVGRRLTASNVAQGIAIVILGGVFLYKGLSDLKIDTDIEGMNEFIAKNIHHSTEGGSAVGAPGLSPTQFPLAIANVLFRPAPWEATSPTYAAACLDLYALWYLVWRRRRRIKELLKEWRSHRLLRLAVPFTVLYVLMLGLAVGNLGIIARQRTLVMPFLLLWVEILPRKYAVKELVHSPPLPAKVAGPVVFRRRKNPSPPMKKWGT